MQSPWIQVSVLFLLTLRKHLHHGYKACSETSRRNFLLTSFWAPGQRPTTNYFEKSMDLILKSTKLIFVILLRFSISPLQGISLLAGTICLVQTDPWSWSLCQCSSWNWELRIQWDGETATQVGAKLEQPQGTLCPWGKSSCSSAALRLRIQSDRGSSACLWFHLGWAGAPHWALRKALQPAEHLLRKRHSVRQKVSNVIQPKIGTTQWISITKPKWAVGANLETFPFFCNRNTEEITRSFTLSSLC